MKQFEANCIGPLEPWACTIWYNGEPHGLILYAVPEGPNNWPYQLERDHPDVRVDGRLLSIYEEDD